MEKLLIIDKNIFQGAKNQLLEFVKSHRVVLPHVLFEECITSNDEGGKKKPNDPIKFLNFATELIKAGAYIGFSRRDIIKKEKDTKKAIDCIIDYRSSEIIRNNTLSLTKEKVKEEAEKANQAFKPMINYCINVSESLYSSTIKKDKLKKAFRQEANKSSCLDRLKKWIKAADTMRSELLKSQFSEISQYVTDKDDQWFSWQLLRLIFSWAFELVCKKNQSGSVFEYNSNDFYDLEYVALLCKADGLISNDNSLIIPMAKVAFHKTVFTSIDKVPNYYKILCS